MLGVNIMENKITLENTSSLRKVFYFFNKLTSNHGTDWLLALTWVVIFELISSILEYSYLDVAQNYIYHIPESLFKEFLIAILLVGFIWFSVTSIVFMQRNQLFYLTFYFILGSYLVITHDITFNLLAHNIINPFEFEFNQFGLYIIIQLFIKVINTYLLYMTYISIKNKKNIK